MTKIATPTLQNIELKVKKARPIDRAHFNVLRIITQDLQNDLLVYHFIYIVVHKLYILNLTPAVAFIVLIVE